MAETDRIGVSGEHYGDHRGYPTGSLHLSRRSREDDVDLQPDQIACGFGQPFGRFSRSNGKGNVLALDIATVPQAHPQCFYSDREGSGGTGHQGADLVDLCWLLRARLGCEQREGEEHAGSNA